MHYIYPYTNPLNAACGSLLRSTRMNCTVLLVALLVTTLRLFTGCSTLLCLTAADSHHMNEAALKAGNRVINN